MPQSTKSLHTFEQGNLVAVTYKSDGKIIKIKEARVQATADDCIRVRFCQKQLFRPRVKWISLEDDDLKISLCREV